MSSKPVPLPPMALADAEGAQGSVDFCSGTVVPGAVLTRPLDTAKQEERSWLRSSP